MRSPLGSIIVVMIMLLLDTYVFQAIKTVSQSASPKTKAFIYIIYWSFSVIAIICFLFFAYTGPDFVSKKIRTYLFATIIGLFMAKLIAVAFFLIDDIRRLIQWIAAKLFFRQTEGEQFGGEGIS